MVTGVTLTLVQGRQYKPAISREIIKDNETLAAFLPSP